MNTTAFHVAPEDVMALLDGELSASEASAASTHVEECGQCAQIAKQLQRTSELMSTWKVTTISSKLETSVKDAATKGNASSELSKPGLFVRASFWDWKHYAAMSGVAISLLLIAVAILTPNLLRMRPVASEHVIAQRAELREYDRYGGAGSAGKLQRDDSPIAATLVSPRTKAVENVLKQNESAPMIARVASLSILVKDFAASRSSLDATLARYHGYSAELNVSTTENSPRSLQASLRIPAPALSSALSDLKTLGRVERETQSGEEVTRQHQDLVARLKNSRDTEQRLREILQQRTGKITDVLKVEEEIARVRGEIEGMEAEQQSLEHRVNFATVELQVAEEYKALLNPPAPAISTRFHNAVVAGYRNVSETVLDILLFFTEYGPVIVLWLAVLGSPVLFFWQRYRRIRGAI